MGRNYMRRAQIVGLYCIGLSAIGCGHTLDSEAPVPETPVRYQRFVLVQVEQPTQGCKDVMPCATVVLALDTKTGQVCRAATLHGENYPLCLHLYESYPDNKAEVERLKEQIKADISGDWSQQQVKLAPCPTDDPLGLRTTQQPCTPLPPKK
jgi:hypothetical protein